MKRLVALPLVIVLAGIPGLLRAADPAAGKSKLEGTWVAVSVVDRGTVDERLKSTPLKLIVKDDKYVYQVGGQSFAARFKADATIKPMTIDVTFEEGPAKGRIMLAIYSIEGDELKICGSEEKRPKEFAPTAQVLFTFKREKP
jgi:uncharacterized protein (TIGR03067 family)